MHDDHFPLTDPAFLDQFEPGPLLGAGGMARVFRAVHRKLGRPVAIKLLAPPRPGATQDGPERFLAEARMAAGLIHPNVVVVFDFGISNDIPYLVTELVEGRSLAELLRHRSALPVGEVFAIARQVLSGLAAIHARGIIHRDLKPENILLAAGAPVVAKIADFGIAKSSNLSDGPDTASGVILGTPAYMAPEQVANDPLTPVADLYAMALLMHRIICGRLPFTSPTALELLRDQLLTEPEFPSGLHPAVQAFLARGLRKRPEHRFASALDMADELELLSLQVEDAGSFFMEELAEIHAPSFPPSSSPSSPTSSAPISLTAPVRRTDRTLMVSSRWARLADARIAMPALALFLCLLAPLVQLAVARRPALDAYGWPAAPDAPADEPAARAPATLEAVRSAARRLEVEAAARALFEYTRGQPVLADLHQVAQVAQVSVAQAVDTAILDVIEAGLRQPGPHAPPHRALSPIRPPPVHRAHAHELATAPTEGDAFAVEFARDLSLGHHGNADALVHAFMMLRLPFRADGEGAPAGSPDALSLHPGNAFAFVGAVARARAALSENELIVALRCLECAVEAHPDHPIGDAARELLAPFLDRAGDPALLGQRLVVRRRGALAAWPRTAAFVTATARHLERRWLSAQGLAPAELRRALLISDVINRLNDEDWRGRADTGPYGSITHLSTVVKVSDNLLDWLSGEAENDSFYINTPLPRKLVVELATAMKLPNPALIAQVGRDAAAEPVRAPRIGNYRRVLPDGMCAAASEDDEPAGADLPR